MRKLRVICLPTFLVLVCLCGVTLGARAEDTSQTKKPVVAPPAASATNTASGPTLSYQMSPPPEGTTSLGGSAPYVQGETKRWPNRPLMLTSATTFALSYVPAVVTAAVNDDDTSDNLFIPLAGPWMEIAREDTSPGNKALLAISGVGQGLGALGLVTSFFVPESRTKRWYLMGNRRFSASPLATRDTFGMTAHGTF